MPLMHHSTNHRQEGAVESLAGSQDEAFFQAQLQRSISLALSAVGFDAVNPIALEAFRAEVEECKSSSCALALKSIEAHTTS